MPILPTRETFEYKGWEVIVTDVAATRHAYYGIAGREGRGWLATARFFGNDAFKKARASIKRMIDADQRPKA